MIPRLSPAAALLVFALCPIATLANKNALPYNADGIVGRWGFYSQGSVASVVGRFEFDGKGNQHK